MKKLISVLLLATGLAASAQAAVILGADVGYLVDGEEAYYSARLGYAFKADPALVHHLELEVGYTEQKDSGVTGEFLPVMVNYRAETIAARRLGFYFGAGAGFARTDVSVPGSGVWSVSDSNNSFAAQAFAGVSIKASDSVALHLGAKYIWIDDVELLGVDVDVGDDVVLSAGISFKF
jgi:opacity protein-like surface antigen